MGDRELQIGGMFAAGMEDMLSMVGADVFADARHQCSEQISCTDDEPELLTRMEHQTDRQQVDLDVDDLLR